LGVLGENLSLAITSGTVRPKGFISYAVVFPSCYLVPETWSASNNSGPTNTNAHRRASGHQHLPISIADARTNDAATIDIHFTNLALVREAESTTTQSWVRIDLAAFIRSYQIAT